MLKSTKYLFDHDFGFDTEYPDERRDFNNVPEVIIDTTSVASFSFISVFDNLIERLWFKEYEYEYETFATNDTTVDVYFPVPLTKWQKWRKQELRYGKSWEINKNRKKVKNVGWRKGYSLYVVLVNFKNGTQQDYYCGECDIPQVTKFLTNKEESTKKNK